MILKALSIQKQLFLIIFLFVFLPSVVIGLLWYETSTESIQHHAVTTNAKLIDQTVKALDMYIANLEVSMYPFANHPNIQQFLTPPTSDYEYFLLYQSIEHDLFAQMLYGRSDILGISLVAGHSKQITNYNRVKEWLDMKHIEQRNRNLMNTAYDHEPFHIIGRNQLAATPVLTVVRKLYNQSTYVFEGLLVVDIDLQQIAHISENLSIDGFQYKIAATDGSVIYDPTGDNLSYEQLSEDMLSKIQSLNSAEGVFQSTVGGQEIMTIYRYSSLTDWIVIAEIPLNHIISDMIRLRNMTMFIVLIIMVVTIAALGGFSFSITRSLTYLQRLMKRVESGDFTVSFIQSKPRNGEIGKLFTSFHRMVAKLKQLIEEVQSAKHKEHVMLIKQKDSALQAMQSYINPHFLYNTLEIINSHAILENNMKISQMTTALAHMFRYNIGNAKQIVKLSEEMKHLQFYLDIQKARYRYLEVDAQLDASIASKVSTIRLTMQPLIENAFLHGYQKHKMKPTYIGVKGVLEQPYYRIQIIDHGGGMQADTMRAYNRAFEDKMEHIIDNTDSFESIGVINVHERIRLAFGEPFGLWFVKSDPFGTIVEIRLPYDEQLEGDGYVPNIDCG